MSDEKAVFALAYLREWVRKIGEPTCTICGDKKQIHTVDVELPLQHLDALDKAVGYYIRTLGKHLQKQFEMDKALAAAKKSALDSMDTKGTAVYLEAVPADNHVYVHIRRSDGSEYSPARAFRNEIEPQLEMWPIPIPFCFSLSELLAVAKVLEAHEKKLPFETVEDN